MIIVFDRGVAEERLQAVVSRLKDLGMTPVIERGVDRNVIAVIGDVTKVSVEAFEAMDGVDKVLRVMSPYKLVNKDFKPDGTRIKLDGVEIGGKAFTVIAGPCGVESEEQLMETAQAVKDAGVKILRASVFKPRTSPYDFQGLREKGLPLLRKVKEELGLYVCTEVMDPRVVGIVEDYCDIMQVGARNMQNYDLLKEVGKARKPVILKRGFSATINEFLMAAEYIMSEGNHDVILCERGIRTFETSTRFTLDVSAVPVIKQATHLPVIVDPSHAAGKRSLVPALAKAGLAAGADGLLIEVHNNPEKALSDAAQQLSPKEFNALMAELKPIASAVGRTL